MMWIRSSAIVLALCLLSFVAFASPRKDTGTQRNSMHSCRVGEFIAGIQEHENVLLCLELPGDFSREEVDANQGEPGMHTCRLGYAMTGFNSSRNQLACTPLLSATTSTFIDDTTQFDGIHACPSNDPVAGISVSTNSFTCAGQSPSSEIVVNSASKRNGMISCPTGSFITGVNVAKTQLLCTPGAVDNTKEFVDPVESSPGADINATESHGMHACPEHDVMTGFHESTNQIACAPVGGPALPRVVDTGTQRQGMHACPLGLPMSGINVGLNLNLCGDEFVVRINSFVCSSGSSSVPTTWKVPHSDLSLSWGDPAEIDWNSTCTSPDCKTTLQGGVVSPAASQTIASVKSGATYTLSLAGGGGTDMRSCSLVLETHSYVFKVQQPGYCEIETVTATNPGDAKTIAQSQCTNCNVTPADGAAQCP
jgi:hypothetical protein